MTKAKFDGTTHISVVLDRSGSMGRLVEETISGFNAWLKETQKAYKNQKARVSVQLFDDRHEWPYKDVPLEDVKPLTREVYFARGWTALRDAFGSALMRLDEVAKKGDKALCIVITDGLENVSKEISSETLRDLITKAEKRKGWEIIYMGANQNALDVGRSLGNKLGANVSTQSTGAGRRAEFASLSHVTRYYAGGGSASGSLSQVAYDSALADEEVKQRIKETK